MSWLDQSYEDALKGIRQLVADVVADLKENGEIVPEPLATKKFSGKFQVRVTTDTHRALAIKAAEKNVSLNRSVSESLAAVCGKYVIREAGADDSASTFYSEFQIAGQVQDKSLENKKRLQSGGL